LVADSRAAQQQLGWQPHYTQLATIVDHAWHFARSQQKP
jgi:UDP-glucose 4-epimerase